MWTKLKKINASFDLIDVVWLTWLSLLVHYWRITYPNSVVFDEVTFGKFLNSYARGEYYFDLHPPLGKLLLAWAGYWGGLDPSFNYDKIGTVFSNGTYVWLRGLTAFAGTLVAPSVALLLRGLGFSRWVMVVATLFVIFENALTVISRTFVFDIFLLSFGFASLAVGVWGHRLRSRFLWFASWILAAAAFSIKWTGFSFIGVLFLWELHQGWRMNVIGKAIRRAVLGLATVMSVYFLVFVVHFSWTPRSGMGDDFMTPAFQSGLKGSRYYNDTALARPGLVAQFIELNQMMWAYQKTMHQSHPYSSSWFTWPFLYRAIYFWGNTEGELKERIYLLGNPVLWWMSTLAVLFFFFQFAKVFWKKRAYFLSWFGNELHRDFFESFNRELNLLVLFLANYLPFIFIGRVMFIYHYLVALIVALMILAVKLEQVKYRRVAWSFVVVVVLAFCYFAPLTYALPLSDAEYQWRLWFSSWL